MIVVEFILLAVAVVLNSIALGAMYWAAGMYFGWSLVLGVTAVFLPVQGLVSIVFLYGERDDH